LELPAPVRVFVVARTPALRAGLRSMLAGEEIRVIGESAEFTGLPAADVVLLAGELAEEFEVGEETVPVLLSEDESAAAALQELSSGGWALVSPDAPAEELRAAVVAAARGLAAVSRELAGVLAERRVAEELDEPLTPRETEVLGLLSRGFSNRAIAQELHLSEHTVKFHVSSIYAKLGVTSRTGAVSRGARYGLVSL
jgi:DNA-binding NarL/FixJ family response regulator